MVRRPGTYGGGASPNTRLAAIGPQLSASCTIFGTDLPDRLGGIMGRQPTLRVVTDDRNGVKRIALRGELDMATVDLLTDALTTSEHDGSKSIMLDLRDLTFMDSTGLHAFLQARDRSQGNGHRLLFVGATSPVRMVFEVAGVASVLEEHEAVSTLGQFTREGLDATGKLGDPGG